MMHMKHLDDIIFFSSGFGTGGDVYLGHHLGLIKALCIYHVVQSDRLPSLDES